MEGDRLVKKRRFPKFALEMLRIGDSHIVGRIKSPLLAARLTHCPQWWPSPLGLKCDHCSEPECRKWYENEI